MKLYIVKGENPGRELVVDKSEFTIGREVDNDFVISEVGVCDGIAACPGRRRMVDRRLPQRQRHPRQRPKVDGGIILRPNDKITVFSHVPISAGDDARAADPRRSATVLCPGNVSRSQRTDHGQHHQTKRHQRQRGRKSSQSDNIYQRAAVVKLIVLAIILVAAAYLIYKLRQTDDQLPADPETTVASGDDHP